MQDCNYLIDKFGGDIDIIEIVDGATDYKQGRKGISAGRIKEEISDATELIPGFKISNGTMYIDKLSDEREIKKHNVAHLTLMSGDVAWVVSPIEQFAHKLYETLVISYNNLDQKHYERNIDDLAKMYLGFRPLYSKNIFITRATKALKEKDKSLVKQMPIFEFFGTMKPIIENIANRAVEISNNPSEYEKVEDILSKIKNMSRRSFVKEKD